ncbi:MAG: GNAT family N-acetyltransferase [Opitutaceae bacterium]|nr:GNAT family N-acetyltransferase [Opitutaceae bacterium]
MSNFQIRAATPEDDASWMRLRKALWPDCSPDRFAVERELYQRCAGVIALAFDENNHAFGFAEVTIRREHVSGSRHDVIPYLEGWYVDPLRQGEGVGRALIDFVSDWARSAGYTELASDTELENVLSQHAHKRLGFREVERVVSFIKDLDE